VRDWFEEIVAKRFQARNPITSIELLNLLECHDSIANSADTLRHRINAIDSLKAVIDRSIEAARVDVDSETAVQGYKQPELQVEAVPRGFGFNLDETQCSEYTDKRELTVPVPSASERVSVPIPGNRNAKRLTLTAFITANGY
jgi:hypothetical protein